MPWNKRTLALPASPPSVRMARRWVAEVLDEVGRPELVRSAELGVSELVTNAILHGDPPLTVRVRGTAEHPRVEVTDQSLVPPNRLPADEDDFLATFGRGLDLVASHSVQWGSDINFSGSGKTVWFEPAIEPRDADEVPSVLFNIDDALAALGDDAVAESDLVKIRLLGMPAQLFGRLRNHFNEIGREVRLLALSDPERYPLAAEAAELFVRIEHERRQARGLDSLNKAIAAGHPRVDLTYAVIASTPESMRQISDLLEKVYETYTGDSLLAVTPPDVLLNLQRWYFGEFARQGRGLEPQPWTGPMHADTEGWQAHAL